jgi:hypothetical protein
MESEPTDSSGVDRPATERQYKIDQVSLQIPPDMIPLSYSTQLPSPPLPAAPEPLVSSMGPLERVRVAGENLVNMQVQMQSSPLRLRGELHAQLNSDQPVSPDLMGDTLAHIMGRLAIIDAVQMQHAAVIDTAVQRIAELKVDTEEESRWRTHGDKDLQDQVHNLRK